MENRSIFIPRHFAIRKCPSSWKKIVKPKRKSTKSAGYTQSVITLITVSNDTFGFLSGPEVSLYYNTQRRRCNPRGASLATFVMRVHHLFNSLENLQETDLPIHKSRHRNLIGGVEHRRHRPADSSGVVRQSQRRELLAIGILEGQCPDFGKISRRHRIRQSPRPRERVLDRVTHVRRAQLRQNRPIRELHHRMHDALRVDDHIHTIYVDIEQPPRLDHLQPLVEQGGRIDGDLLSHVPTWMLQRLRHSDLRELLAWRLPKRPARCRENQALHVPRFTAFKALENCAVFAVHR